jgi:hypothetical protein
LKGISIRLNASGSKGRRVPEAGREQEGAG